MTRKKHIAIFLIVLALMAFEAASHPGAFLAIGAPVAHAVDWIADKPLQGWGLDASRMFGPGIVLHPHDAALQVWL